MIISSIINIIYIWYSDPVMCDILYVYGTKTHLKKKKTYKNSMSVY